MDLLRSTFFFLAKVAIIKTKSATIAFYSSPPFLLLALAPFFFLRSYDFGAVPMILELVGLKKSAF